MLTVPTENEKGDKNGDKNGDKKGRFFCLADKCTASFDLPSCDREETQI
jgi:hypothetical protein